VNFCPATFTIRFLSERKERNQPMETLAEAKEIHYQNVHGIFFIIFDPAFGFLLANRS